jgi:glycosyltransferase involved in cell wall biosynthesis
MRVALLSYNAQLHNAVGNLLAEKARFFFERGAEVRLFVEDQRRLHPALRDCCTKAAPPSSSGPVWDYLRQADLVLAVYSQYFDLLQYLPGLAGGSGRVVLLYLGVTPPHLWPDQHREGLRTSLQQRGLAWCADQVLTLSDFSRRELIGATQFPDCRLTTLAPPIDVERFRCQADERFLHDRLGVTGRIILHVGRLAGNKRVPLLIEALARLDDSSLHAVIVGARDDVYAMEAQRCQELAQRLGLAGRVHLPGQFEDTDLPRVYRSAAALVIPSLHEGYCLPVIEAMACGVPVLASRSAALPETVGAAGLTFAPDDVEDLARRLGRVLAAPRPAPVANGTARRRIAVVCFRFGPNIVGGAETSLRMMAHALHATGHHVEVFTTCTTSVNRWQNDLPAGTVTQDGLRVHRFRADPQDAAAHDEIYQSILAAGGHVTPAMELAYLENSIHSGALCAALRARCDEFDAIITGPYLFGLTADIVQAFPDRTLLVPCFHDEPLARLAVWPRLAGAAAGILYHSGAEQQFAQQQLGVNHPNSHQIGAWVPIAQSAAARPVSGKPYLIYCGRHANEKNIPLLLEWMRRYHTCHAGGFDLVLIGQGDMTIPDEPWLKNLGRVDEESKRSLFAGARALVQLSVHESLSLVVLEAWAQGTPVLVHEDCEVLADQVARAGGGAAVRDGDAFISALADLWQNESVWRERGANGRAFVERHYASRDAYLQRLEEALAAMQRPLGEQMRQRGRERAESLARPVWQERFGEFVENTLTRPGRPYREEVCVESLRAECRASIGAATMLMPLRLTNTGTHAAAPRGPGRTVLCCVIEAEPGRISVSRQQLELPALLMPGQSQVAAMPLTLPSAAGSYRLRFWTERPEVPASAAPAALEVPLTMTAAHASSSSCAAELLETVQETLPRTQSLQQLPTDYVDVTEGSLAPIKSFVKRKLLNNFKRGYVDVLSRQQSQVNEQLVLMVQQLAESCALLDHAVAGIQQRLDALEEKLEERPDSFSARSITRARA